METTRQTVKGKASQLEHRVIVGGQTRWLDVRTDPGVSVNGRVLVITGTSQDITERHRLEDQLHQKQKLEAIGRLAGGVAHDFNNMLTVINTLSEELAQDPSLGASQRADVQAIGEAGQRAASLTAQLLTFSRRTILTLTVLDLNQTVHKLGAMLTRLIGEDVKLSMALSTEFTPINADPSQVDQVLVNLVLNARDAMPSGGELTISTKSMELGPNDTSGLPAGKYVALVVRDTGVGMSDEVKGKLFEPFFTTKGVGKGTGLGLATLYGIMQQLHGHVSVESSVGKGSTFTLLFPTADRAQPTKSKAAENDAVVHGSGTILVVEDEPAVRQLVRRVVKARGYVVLDAPDGVQALALMSKHEGPIDLLITDVVMPNMGGRELAERIRERDPRVKVIFMSGYTDDEVIRQGVSHAEQAFLQKPFSATGLAEKVREVLEANR
jgi:two-component system, cell cycle sensor histidine kinase and response regulator CckA